MFKTIEKTAENEQPLTQVTAQDNSHGRQVQRRSIEGILFVQLLTVGLTVGLSSCNDSGFISPPTQNLGSTLNTTSAEQNPHFSYDGRYLVFASDRGGHRGVWLYDLQSRRLLPLPGLNQPGSIQDQPDISADGRYIVYVSEQFGKPDIFVYDRQTLEAENITKNWLGEVRHPTISGNGRFIAFETNRSGQWNIEIYDRGLDADLSLPEKGRGRETEGRRKEG